MQALSEVHNVFLDKTGTLTYGNFQVTSVELDPKYYSHVFALQSRSRHPIAKSIVQFLQKNAPELEVLQVDGFTENIGKGVCGIIHERPYRMEGISGDSQIKRVGLFEDDQLIGSFALKDTLRTDALEAVERLQKMGLNLHLISGDNPQIVKAIAEEVGLAKNQWHAELGLSKKPIWSGNSSML